MRSRVLSGPKWLPVLSLFVAAVVLSAGTHAIQGDGGSAKTQADLRQLYDKANKMGSIHKGRIFRAAVTPNWFANNTRFWYRNDLQSGTKEFIVIDAEKATRNVAFDHKKLAEALSKSASNMYLADKLPFDTIKFVDEQKAVEFQAAGSKWKCNLTNYEIANLGKADAKKEEPKKGDAKKKGIDDQDEVDLTPWDVTEEPWDMFGEDTDVPQKQKKGQQGAGKKGPPTESKSPDGKWTAEVKEFNLHITEVASKKTTQVTTDGVEKNAYGGFSWAPNSKFFVTYKTEPGDSPKAFLVDSVPPKGAFRPTEKDWIYRTPGDKVDIREMVVVDVESKKPIKVEIERIDFGNSPQLHWSKDRTKFTFERIYRGHQRVRVVEVDVKTGKVRDIIDEKSATRIVRNTGSKQDWHVLRYLDDTNELIWASERDGWNHLYLIDAKKGTVKNQITQGPWVMRALDRLDEKTRQIWFAGSGRNLDQDPHFIHHYRVNFDGTGLVALTEGNGNHTIAYSPDRKYLLDTYSRTNSPPVTTLRRVSDGALVCDVEKADISALLQTGWKPAEPFFTLGRDGKTDIWGVAYFPTHFDPKVKYPVIEYIYAGPWTCTSPKVFGFSQEKGTMSDSARHALAELGFVVVVIDGMGLPNRSRAFHDVSYKNNGDCGLPDRILWIKALAKKYPNLDIDKVGIYGHSGGGYSSLRALLMHGDFYKVAVSSSGNHDPRGYNLPYTEQWMSWPVGDYYVDQSNVTHAAKLKGKLLLIHGEVDNNVVPNMTTLKVVDALIKANKDFDLLIMPTKQHAVSGNYVTRRTYDYFVRHLLGVEPPPPGKK